MPHGSSQTPCSHIQQLDHLRDYGWMPGSIYTTGGRTAKEPNNRWRLVPISLRKRVIVTGLPQIEGFLVATDGVRAALITLEDKYFDGHLDFLTVVGDTNFNIGKVVKDSFKLHEPAEVNMALVKHYASKYL